jgi:FkbM family methyltransferase
LTDYSQCGEQAAILRVLDGISKGRFIDVGAWRPDELSNTRALYDLGWRGVVVEPSPEPVGRLLDVYGNDPEMVVFAAAVGLEPGHVAMHISDDAVSTSSDAEYRVWATATGWRGRMTVPVVTVEYLTNAFGGFDFWDIDTEGQSAEILIHALKLGIEPACICVEHDNRHQEILAAATRRGYHCVLATDSNLVLAKAAR